VKQKCFFFPPVNYVAIKSLYIYFQLKPHIYVKSNFWPKYKFGWTPTKLQKKIEQHSFFHVSPTSEGEDIMKYYKFTIGPDILRFDIESIFHWYIFSLIWLWFVNFSYFLLKCMHISFWSWHRWLKWKFNISINTQMKNLEFLIHNLWLSYLRGSFIFFYIELESREKVGSHQTCWFCETFFLWSILKNRKKDSSRPLNTKNSSVLQKSIYSCALQVVFLL